MAKMEVNMEVEDKQVMCPMGGRSYAVSVKKSCIKCPFLTEIKKKDSEQMIPAKVHCEPPIKNQSVIFESRKIEWNTIRNKKEEV